MMSYSTKSKDKAKKFAEVFTPAGIVFEMVMQSGLRDVYSDIDKTILDPAVGEGQYPCAGLVWKMFCNLDRLNEDNALLMLKSFYGMDIQAESVKIAREHLLKTLADAFNFFTGKNFSKLDEAQAIVDKNIFVQDFFKYMQPKTLFD